MNLPERPLQILLADDHELFRDGLKEIFGTYPDLAVVGEAGNHSEVMSALSSTEDIDVMLLDVEMPGTAVTAMVRDASRLRPGISIIILTMHSDAAILHSLLPLGIRGYILKTASRHELVSAIRATRSGGNNVTLAVSPDILVQRDLPHDPVKLSQPESYVLRLAAKGLTNAQIGRQLSLTEPSVKRHLRNIFAKLGAVSRMDAVNKAREAGLLANRRNRAGG